MYLNFEQIIPIMAVSYLYRVAFEGVTLPLSYYFSELLKECENIDVYDFIPHLGNLDCQFAMIFVSLSYSDDYLI
jgi:hypothetical protein